MPIVTGVVKKVERSMIEVAVDIISNILETEKQIVLKNKRLKTNVISPVNKPVIRARKNMLESKE